MFSVLYLFVNVASSACYVDSEFVDSRVSLAESLVESFPFR
jgi:hypothetical protein